MRKAGSPPTGTEAVGPQRGSNKRPSSHPATCPENKARGHLCQGLAQQIRPFVPLPPTLKRRFSFTWHPQMMPPAGCGGRKPTWLRGLRAGTWGQPCELATNWTGPRDALVWRLRDSPDTLLGTSTMAVCWHSAWLPETLPIQRGLVPSLYRGRGDTTAPLADSAGFQLPL